MPIARVLAHERYRVALVPSVSPQLAENGIKIFKCFFHLKFWGLRHHFRSLFQQAHE